MSGKRCTVCERIGYPKEGFTMDLSYYHKQCFKCSHCNQRLSLGTFAQLKGTLYCKPHFKQLFASLGGSYDKVMASGRQSIRDRRRRMSGRAARKLPEIRRFSDEVEVADIKDELFMSDGTPEDDEAEKAEKRKRNLLRISVTSVDSDGHSTDLSSAPGSPPARAPGRKSLFVSVEASNDGVSSCGIPETMNTNPFDFSDSEISCGRNSLVDHAFGLTPTVASSDISYYPADDECSDATKDTPETSPKASRKKRPYQRKHKSHLPVTPGHLKSEHAKNQPAKTKAHAVPTKTVLSVRVSPYASTAEDSPIHGSSGGGFSVRVSHQRKSLSDAAAAQRVTKSHRRVQSDGSGPAVKKKKTFGLPTFVMPSFKSDSNSCAACQLRCYPKESTKVDDLMYHKRCFRCSHCNQRLTMKSFAQMQGVLYCRTHFKQLFASLGGNYNKVLSSGRSSRARFKKKKAVRSELKD
eukprot:302182_1